MRYSAKTQTSQAGEKGYVLIAVMLLITLMIIVSDNTATDVLYRMVGGPEAVNRRMETLGLKSTRAMGTARAWFEALRGEPDRLVDVAWAPTSTSVFLVNIQVEALDRARLLSDVTRALSDTHVNILSASVTTTRERIALSRFTFEMADAAHLGSVLKSVRSVEGVYDVYRV